ncbi:hypothetical protein FBQ97_17840, partial [Acidobacteria bacterium ACD]|nr:hypothetical protein [Acidobacteria bacterium ACD]
MIDELHAFAGDDRGWHLVSVLERVSRIAGRDVQRVGLSATVGNPEDLLGWLAGGSAGRRRVVSQEPSGGAEPEVRLDWVATQANAAQVIARLHRDEKRLVFCDSRARVEELTFALREAGVPAFAAHGSLAAEERRRAEEAFGGAEPAVIVATSALELGIDIGDLDRLLQVDAPATVSSCRKRLGRTGRRPGTRRNCLFLATDDEAFLRAAALLRLWRGGWVEPVAPPASPFHILAQQLLALALQTSGLPRHGWTEWIGGMPGFAAMDGADAARIEEYLLEKGFLFDDGGVVSFGPEGEASFGGRRFLELLSVFSSDPLFSVRFGAKEIGKVDPATFQLSREGDPVLLLAGQAWHVTRIEWQDRIAKVVRRVAKDLIANDETEISEVVRRRLFQDLGPEKFRRAVAKAFSDWCFERRHQLPPEWAAVDSTATEGKAREFLQRRFEACYPFHPATLSVFQRKWQALPQYQQTRGTLAMLAQWISIAAQDAFRKARTEPLLTLGSAPLSEPGFRSVVLGQLGESRLVAAIETDLAGEQAHSRSLDADTMGPLRDIHRRVGTAILFESSGGQTDKVAHLPELRFALGEPELDTTTIDNAAFALEDRSYFIRKVGTDGFRIGYQPTMKKVVSDR